MIYLQPVATGEPVPIHCCALCFVMVQNRIEISQRYYCYEDGLKDEIKELSLKSVRETKVGVQHENYADFVDAVWIS